MKFKCIKSLYKSTYKKNAFTKGKSYEVYKDDEQFFYVIDSTGHPFNLSKDNEYLYYFIWDYFVKPKDL